MQYRIPAAAAIAVTAALSTSMVADAAPRWQQSPPDTTTTVGAGTALDVLGDVTRSDRVDHHLLVVEGDAALTVDVAAVATSHRAPNWSIRIIDASGRRIANERGHGGASVAISVPAGSYLVEISGRTGSYHLTASADLADEPVTVTPGPDGNDPAPSEGENN